MVNIPFHAPLKRNKLKTFTSLSKVVSVKSSGKKEIKIKTQRNLFGQLLILSQVHNIDLEKVLTYPLNTVPWAMATSDGFPLKTNKATLLHKIEDKYAPQIQDEPQMKHSVHLVDGNALLQSLTDLPDTFGDLAKCVFSALPLSEIVHFVTDTYVQSQSRMQNNLEEDLQMPMLTLY